VEPNENVLRIGEGKRPGEEVWNIRFLVAKCKQQLRDCIALIIIPKKRKKLHFEITHGKKEKTSLKNTEPKVNLKYNFQNRIAVGGTSTHTPYSSNTFQFFLDFVHYRVIWL